MDSFNWANPEAIGVRNSSSEGWQARREKANRYRPGNLRYVKGICRPDNLLYPGPTGTPDHIIPPPGFSLPTFSKGFVFSDQPPFSTQLQVRKRAFLPYDTYPSSQETSSDQSTFTNQYRPLQQPLSPELSCYTEYPPSNQFPPTQLPFFNNTTPFQQSIPGRRLATPKSSRPVRLTEPPQTQSEIEAFREAMLRVPRNEQERREQEALWEAELDKVE